MKLAAVLFDFGNTLVSTRLDWPSVMPRNLSGLAGALRGHLPGLDPARLKRDFLFLKKAAGERAGHTGREITAVESLRHALSLQGIARVHADILQAGVDGFFSAEEAAYPLIFGITEALADLKEKGLVLAVVSNATCGHLVRRTLKSRNLSGYFENVTTSADVGVRKPEPAIFNHVLSLIGVEPQAAAMVGDIPEIDVAGARGVGMQPVLADFFGDQPEITPQGPRPDAVVRRPAELVEWVAGQSKRR